MDSDFAQLGTCQMWFFVVVVLFYFAWSCTFFNNGCTSVNFRKSMNTFVLNIRHEVCWKQEK